VRLCDPEVAKVVTQVATPAVRDWVPQLVMVVAPSLKLTVPEGVPPGPETVAVRVVEAPTAGEVGEDVREVVVEAALTVSELEPVEPE
jgi:tRNA A37 threonylcarbamoyladenosine synthetase subunit TsaC/SUA5/YrdC